MKTFVIGIIVLLFTLTACQEKDIFPTPANIINSPNKVEIDISDLPTNVLSFVNKHYPEKYITNAKEVPSLGFEIGLRNGMGWSIGKYYTVHFLIASPGQFISTSNFLKSENKCFELHYPITYVMKDGTEITGDSATTKTKIKAWYEDNPEEKDQAEIKYPFDIIYKDSSIITLNDETEKEAACN